MCGSCGCAEGDVGSFDAAAEARRPAVGQAAGAAPPPRRLSLARQLLERNDLQAMVNRERFQACSVRAVNLLSSPGSGKTALLEALGRFDGARLRQAVVVGDLATDNDARRLRDAGLPAVQISTGQSCHLESAQLAAALDRLEATGTALADLDLLWIENVGNLVCPAAYDLGESLRVVLLSTCEGEDKPLKYPAIFHSADLVLISKVDLADAVGFDRALALRSIARVATRAMVLEVSARSGQGLEALLALLALPAWPPPSSPAAAGRTRRGTTADPPQRWARRRGDAR
jgi:hydrogenase nickel incorporation protein HypB